MISLFIVKCLDVSFYLIVDFFFYQFSNKIKSNKCRIKLIGLVKKKS